MTDLRNSQSVIEALDSGAASLRASQTVIEVLEKKTSPMRLSQSVIEVLHRAPLTPGGGGGVGPVGVNPGAGVIPSTAPEVFVVLTLGATDYAFGVGQMNDDPSWYGGSKQGKILDISSIKYTLTKEGGPQAVSFTVTLLDGDRVFADRAGTTSPIRGGTCAVYVIDHAARLAGQTPKRLANGYITKYESDDKFVFRLTVKDALSVRLSKLDKEPILPPNRFTLVDFPALDKSMDGKPIPLIMGKVSDESEAVIQGEVPPVYVATINLSAFGGIDKVVDAYIWAQGAFVNNGITSVWYNDPTTPLVRYMVPVSAFGTLVYTPFWPGWAATGITNNFIDYNGIRYTPFFIDAAIPQAALVRQGNILIAANIHGTEDVGDASGNMIESPAYLTSFLLNTYVFNKYLTGVYPTLPVYDSPSFSNYSWIDTATFDEVETYFQGRLTGGYKVGFILGHDGESQTVFDFLRDMCAGVWMDIGTNLDGQLIASVYDPLDTPVDTFDAQTDIQKDSYAVTLNEEQYINRVDHEFARYYVAPYAPAPTPAQGDPVPTTPIPEYGTYRSGVKTTEDSAAQALIGETVTFSLQNNVVRDSTVAADVSARIIAERLGPTGYGPHEFSFKGGWRLIENVRLGKNIIVKHPAKWKSGTQDLCRVTAIDIYPLQHRVVLSGVVITHS